MTAGSRRDDRTPLSPHVLPRAERPDLVVAFLEAVLEGADLSTELGLIAAHAEDCQATARLLGFLKKDGRVSNAGRALVSLDDTARRARMALAFEACAGGTAWAAWHGVKSLPEVNVATARAFLTAEADLSEDDRVRRAAIITTWWTELMPYHPAVRDDPSGSPPRRRQEALGQTAVLDTAQSAYVVQALGPGTRLLRVATAYLSVDGYEILVDPLSGASMRLLVGSETTFTSVADILRVFRESLELGIPSGALQGAATNLYRGVVTGRVRVRNLDPRYKPKLHAKIYLFDEFAAYVTSANLSRNGLRSNIEVGYVVRSDAGIRYYRERFDELFEQAQDLGPQLLRQLERSWVFEPLVSPYFHYLRVLLEVFPRAADLAGITERRLSPFQELIVAAVLRALREERGALLVAPTGTGKTIMAMHAAATLFEQQEVRRIFVLCPNERLKAMWKREARRYRLQPTVVTHGIVQGKGQPAEGSEERLREVLAEAHDCDLVIVDECHVFRNPETNGFENLATWVRERRAPGTPRLLLLSATPISRGLDDLNALLALVGGTALPTIDAVRQEPRVVNVTLPFIVRHFGRTADGQPGTGLDFAGELRQFGVINVRTNVYRSPTEAAFEHIERLQLRVRRTATDSRQLSFVGMPEPLDERSVNMSRFVQLMLLRRTESSPRAAQATIERLLTPRGDWPLEPVDPEEFRAELEELRRLLPTEAEDTKLHALADLLRRRQRTDRVLIFSMWAATVQYLADALPRLVRDRRIASITGEAKVTERGAIIRRFAPIAQEVAERREESEIDVLVATDAIAEGENLQDATIVVNYDLPWTPLVLVQRVGRVDRPTREQRLIELWNFFPGTEAFERQVGLWRRLDPRAELYDRLARTRVIGEQDRDLAVMRTDEDLGLVRQFYEHENFEPLRQREYIPTSALVADRGSAPEEDLRRAAELATPVRSCKAGERPGTFAVLSVDDRHYCVFRPAAGGGLEVAPEHVPYNRVLPLVRADRDETLVAAPAGFVDDIARLVEEFARPRNIDVERVRIVCAAAIVPGLALTAPPEASSAET